MLDIFKRFAVDVDAEDNGKWMDFHGAQVKLARMGNQKFNTLITEKYAEHEETLNKGGDEAEVLAEKLMAEVLAEAIIKDWKGFAFKGEELKYSKKAVIDLFSQREMRDFRREILNMADEVERFRMREEEEQLKNS